MNKRVHQIAKERGLPAKDVLERLQAAGLKVKAVSSSVDEADARRVLGDGDGSAQSPAPTDGGRQQRPTQRDEGGSDRSGAGGRISPGSETRQDAPAAGAPRSEAPNAQPEGAPESSPRSGSDGPNRRSESETAHKRPTRDSLQGERAPGSAGGRRRVVIDSQA
jgi:translation initiation factor IF-2